MTEKLLINVGDGEAVTGLFYPAPEGDAGMALILAPGAGAGHTSDFMVTFAEGLSSRGIDIVTFNFSYLEKGRKYPDRAERLEQCYEAAIEATRDQLPSGRRLFAGGKSMGGRIASQVAVSGRKVADDLAGLVFLGYPLHPPGKPEKQRSAHLPEIRVPMLFCQGSRDAFGTPEEIRHVAEGLSAPVEVFEVVGGDHSFKVLKRSPLSQEETHTRVMDEIARWVR